MSAPTASEARALSEAPTRFEPWPFWRRWLGQRSERFAARWLRHRGFRILAANWSSLGGEIDLMTLDPDGETMVVVEVRSTSTGLAQQAADSVSISKQCRLTLAVMQFLRTHNLANLTTRFDVLALSWIADQSEPQILHLPGAFEAIHCKRQP